MFILADLIFIVICYLIFLAILIVGNTLGILHPTSEIVRRLAQSGPAIGIVLIVAGTAILASTLFVYKNVLGRDFTNDGLGSSLIDGSVFLAALGVLLLIASLTARLWSTGSQIPPSVILGGILILVFGCLGFAALQFGLIALIPGSVGTSQGLEMQVVAPGVAVMDRSFELIVSVDNKESNEGDLQLQFTDDLADTNKVQIVSSTPMAKGAFRLNQSLVSMNYGTLPVDETKTVRLELTPKQRGALHLQVRASVNTWSARTDQVIVNVQ